MSPIAGNLKAKSFTLQGNGAAGADVEMLVKDDEFKMKMGNDVLMTVGVADKDENFTSTETTLTIEKNTTFTGNVAIQGTITIGNTVLDEQTLINLKNLV